jgi:hypothetical protein
MPLFTSAALLAPFCLCRDDSTLAKGPPNESGMEVMVPGPLAQEPWPPWDPGTPMDPEVFPGSPCPPPWLLSAPPAGLGPEQEEGGPAGCGPPGPPVLSGSALFCSLLSSSRGSDFFPVPFFAAAAAAAAARSCLRNFARRFWNQT